MAFLHIYAGAGSRLLSILQLGHSLGPLCSRLAEGARQGEESNLAVQSFIYTPDSENSLHGCPWMYTLYQHTYMKGGAQKFARQPPLSHQQV